jgi:hypothetical protein
MLLSDAMVLVVALNAFLDVVDGMCSPGLRKI